MEPNGEAVSPWARPLPPPGCSRPPSGAASPPGWLSAPQPYQPPNPYLTQPAQHWPDQQWDTWGGPPQQTNPWSIAALVTGIFALVPVAVATGIVALVQLRERPGRGRGLAIGGLVAAGCWSLLAVAGVVFLVFGLGPPVDPYVGTVARAGGPVVGTCLSTRSGGAVDVALPCEPPHDAEVYLVSSLSGGSWPGTSTVQDSADDLCYDGFAGYVGAPYEDSAYEFAFYAPDQAEWDAGERAVICVVVPYDEDSLTGSVNGTRR